MTVCDSCVRRCKEWLRAARLGLTITDDPNLTTRIRGYYDPDRRRIVLAADLTEGQRRATLAHELVHAERGDTHQRDVWEAMEVEDHVEQVAARMLMPIVELADAMLDSDSEVDVARALVVDLTSLRSRLANLTPAERTYLQARRQVVLAAAG